MHPHKWYKIERFDDLYKRSVNDEEKLI